MVWKEECFSISYFEGRGLGMNLGCGRWGDGEGGKQLRGWKAALSSLRSPVKLGVLQSDIPLKQRSSDFLPLFCEITKTVDTFLSCHLDFFT